MTPDRTKAVVAAVAVALALAAVLVATPAPGPGPEDRQGRTDGRWLELGPGLEEQVGAGDAQVGHAVGHELDDVVGAHEEDIQREALDLGRQRPGVTRRAGNRRRRTRR